MMPNGGLRQKPERKPIRWSTKAQQAERRQYLKQRKAFLAVNQRCEIYPWLLATEVHHVQGRGKLLLVESTWMALSHVAHDKIHREPAWAYRMGFLKRRA